LDPSFYDKIQEFSASLVLVDSSDLSTFGRPLEILEALEKEAKSQRDPASLQMLSQIREALESILMGGESEQASLQRIEEVIRSFLDSRESTIFQGHTEQVQGEQPAPVEKKEEGLGKEESEEILKEFILEAKERFAELEMDLVQMESSPQDTKGLSRILRTLHTIKGVAGFLNLHLIHKLCHHTEDLMDDYKHDPRKITHQQLSFLFDSVDLLKALVDHVERLGVEPKEGPLLEKWNELTGMSQGKEPLSQETSGTLMRGQPFATGWMKHKALPVSNEDLRPEKQDGQTHALLGNQLIKVDSKKLTDLLNLVGELVISASKLKNQSMHLEGVSPAFLHQLNQIQRFVSETRKVAMGLSMVPIKRVFQKMIRVVRDLERRSGKRVKLEIKGGETEVDRSMAERLFEPLVHIIRNAVDHGIEPPDLRKKIGKTPEGRISLSAHHRGSQLIIEIEDDGRGLDRQKILERAKQLGIVPQSDDFSFRSLDQLIFSPGVSTSEKVTEISGRGVGMEAVEKTIKEIGGKITVESRPGQGCCFSITLPITLTVVEGLVVRMGGHKLVIPLSHVRETMPMDASSCIYSGKKAVGVVIRQQLYPVISKDDLVDVINDQQGPSRETLLILEHEGRTCALLVDDVIEKQEVVLKPLGFRLAGLKHISSGAIFGDGKVGWLMDVPSLIEHLGQ
jgi:two-component system chemotaxis sensor kinase CheA